VNEVVEGLSDLQVQEAVVDVEMLEIGFDVLAVGVDGAEDGQPTYAGSGPVGSDAGASVECSYGGFVGKWREEGERRDHDGLPPMRRSILGKW
jgi:hypothetical protein